MSPVWMVLLAGCAQSPAEETEQPGGAATDQGVVELIVPSLTDSEVPTDTDPPVDTAKVDTGLGYEDYPVWIEGTDRRFTTVQNAIWGAKSGDVIYVEPGTYYENLNLLGKDIELRSVEGPSVTVLDGSGVGTVVSLRANEPSTTVVAGFTITNGEGDERHGGGFFLEWADAEIAHNDIVGNDADIAGGVYMRYGGAWVHNNIIRDNEARQGGGGFCCSACWGTFEHNTVYDNESIDGPIAEYNWGIADFEANILLEDDAETGPGLRYLDPRPKRTFSTDDNVLWPKMTWTTEEAWPEGVMLIADPQLLDPAGGDFQPATDSPVWELDAGAHGGDEPWPY